MKAFAKAVNQKGGVGKGETQEIMLAYWLAVITEKDIENKEIIKHISINHYAHIVPPRHLDALLKRRQQCLSHFSAPIFQLRYQNCAARFFEQSSA